MMLRGVKKNTLAPLRPAGPRCARRRRPARRSLAAAGGRALSAAAAGHAGDAGECAASSVRAPSGSFALHVVKRAVGVTATARVIVPHLCEY